MGNARIKDYSHTLIHYYDLNPILSEINKLGRKSENISKQINFHQEYSSDISNYLKLLNITRFRVENKIQEITPTNFKRIKRGLINGIGSFFKAVTGNLDASDGEQYEYLIRELQNNQKILQTNILKEKSLSLSVIKRFNHTIEQISHNEKLLDSKINQIALITQKTAYRENSLYMKDVINQIINIYEIIDSILQDIENSLTFSKLKTMHPSIIKSEDLFNELNRLQKQFGNEQMPIPVNLESILLYEKIISLDCFVFNNKITYLLHIPIMLPRSFEYFHLYSVPIFDKSRFKVVLPRNKFLLKNQLHYTYQQEECQRIVPQYYVCENEDLQEIQGDMPCAIKLLNSDENASTCKQTEIKITQPLTNRLADTNQWILAAPAKETIQIKCNNQEETRSIFGTYLCSIPEGCQVKIKSKLISNIKKSVESSSQPILLPDIQETPTLLPTLNLSPHLQGLKLDELHKLRNEILEVQPDLAFSQIETNPSIWSLVIYILLIFGCIILAYKKLLPKCKKQVPTLREEADIQLPRLAR